MSEEMKHKGMVGDLNPAKRSDVREKIRQSKLGKKRPDLSERYKGEGNPHYKNGIRTGKRIMLEIYEVCEICNSDKNLEVHHIDENKENNEIGNLRMLCKSCHSKQHRKIDWHNKVFEARKRKGFQKFPIELYPNYGRRNKNQEVL